MSTEDFVLAVIKFINRYGPPREFVSDNAKAFVAGASVWVKYSPLVITRKIWVNLTLGLKRSLFTAHGMGSLRKINWCS